MHKHRIQGDESVTETVVFSVVALVVIINPLNINPTTVKITIKHHTFVPFFII
jgi:hypothetical protein